VLLMIDYFAIRSDQYDYLIHLYEEWEPIKRLSLLPNFRYSVPLAFYLKSRSQNSNSNSNAIASQNCSNASGASADDLMTRADILLQEALIMFPGWLMLMLEKCSVEADSFVTKCTYFGLNSQQVPQAISQLISLYIGRCHLVWKDKEIMSWLEKNTKVVIERIAKKDKFVDVCADR
jgi:Transcriptional repressor TCF25